MEIFVRMFLIVITALLLSCQHFHPATSKPSLNSQCTNIRLQQLNIRTQQLSLHDKKLDPGQIKGQQERLERQYKDLGCYPLSRN